MHRGARLPVRLESLSLPTIAVESQHQLAAYPLPQRVGGDERLELGNQLCVAPQREIRIDPIFDGNEPELLETSDLRLGEGLVREVDERLTSPERESLAQLLCRTRRILLEHLPGFGREVFEAVGIERVLVEPQLVPRGLRQGDGRP